MASGGADGDMPSSHLQRLLEDIPHARAAVVNLDGCIRKDDRALRRMLDAIQDSPAVHTLSIRFSMFSPEMVAALQQFLMVNATVSALYLFGSDIKDDDRIRIAEIWRSSGKGHVISNMGYTLHRRVES